MRHWIGAAALGFALVAASAGAASAQTPNIAGVWEVHGQITFGDRIVSANPTCTFRQAAGRLSGVCVGPNARGALTGLIAGRSVSWTWLNAATTAIGVTGRTNFNGTYVNSHLIQGSMTSSATAGTGSFTQTR
jgi:hypothetical protein